LNNNINNDLVKDISAVPFEVIGVDENPLYVLTVLCIAFDSWVEKKTGETVFPIATKTFDSKFNLVASYRAGKFFKYVPTDIYDIKSLSDALFSISTNSKALVIRGALREGVDPKGIVQKTKNFLPNQIPYFESAASGVPWVMLDIDHIVVPEHLDYKADPLPCIEYVIACLPHYFQNVSYHYQLSSSAGKGAAGIIKVHLWFWLNKPVHDDKMKYWGEQLNKNGKLVDTKLFDSVQAHFTCAPIFESPETDPFPSNRSGFIKHASEAVSFPDLSEYVALVTPDLTYAKVLYASKCQGSKDGYKPTTGFKNYLKLIGDGENGTGFHNAIYAAMCSYVGTHGIEGTDKNALKNILKKRILSAYADSAKGHDKNYVAKEATDSVLDAQLTNAFINASSEKKTGKVLGIKPHYTNSKIYTADQGGLELDHHLNSFMTDPRDMGIVVSAGGGKSTKMYERVGKRWRRGEKIEIYIPTHKLGKEAVKGISLALKNPDEVDLFKKYKPTGAVVQVIHGRDYTPPDGSDFEQCYKLKEVKELEAKRLPVLSTICKSYKIEKQADGANKKCFDECEFYTSCGYIKQFLGDYDLIHNKFKGVEWDARIYPHAYLDKDRILDKELPDKAIIDENYINSMMYGVKADSKGITFQNIESSPCSENLKKLLINAPANVQLFAYLRKHMDEEELIHDIDSALEVVADTKSKVTLFGMHQKEQLKAAKALPERSNMDKFLTVLRTELLSGRDNAHGISVGSEGFALAYRKSMTRFVGTKGKEPFKTPVLTIDADLDELFHREFFPECEYHKIYIPRIKAKVITSHSAQWSKKSMLRVDVGHLRIAKIQSFFDSADKNDKLLAISNQAITGNEKEGKKITPLVTVQEGSELAHFGDLRGYNHWTGFSPVIFGRNQPGFVALERLAGAFWYDSPDALMLGVDKPVNVVRGYRTTTGYEVGVNVEVHPDPRIQRLLEQIREKESLQGIDRSRLLFGKAGDAKTKVWIFSNLVLDIDVDHVLSEDEVMARSTKLTEVWNKVDGLLPLSIDWLTKTFPEVFEKNGAKNYLQSVGASKEALLNSLLIDKFLDVNLFRYNLVGKKNELRKCLSRYSKTETKERLSLIFGGQIELQ
jgi:hypothetical protein